MLTKDVELQIIIPHLELSWEREEGTGQPFTFISKVIISITQARAMCCDTANKADLQNIPALSDHAANGLIDADMRTPSTEAQISGFTRKSSVSCHFTTEYYGTFTRII